MHMSLVDLFSVVTGLLFSANPFPYLHGGIQEKKIQRKKQSNKLKLHKISDIIAKNLCHVQIGTVLYK